MLAVTILIAPLLVSFLLSLSRMWSNESVREFIEWLRAHNQRKKDEFDQQVRASGEPLEKHKMMPLVGFYGLDLYGLFSSMNEVLSYLREHAPDAALQAQRNYAMLQRFKEEAGEYGMAVAYGLIEPVQKQVVAVLKHLLQRGGEYVAQEGFTDGDALVATKLNAKVVADAERYYAATLSSGQDRSWNVRDTHMVDTLLEMMQVYSDRKREALGKLPKDAAAVRALSVEQQEAIQQVLSTSSSTRDLARSVVWAHNSHLGDARATNRVRLAEHNVGQLVRQKLGLPASFSVGFSMYDGTVSAATSWGGERQTMRVNPGLPNSYELLFHQAAVAAEPKQPNYLILLRSNTPTTSVSAAAVRTLGNPPRYQRAIGVQYVKATEFQSHYFTANLPRQFDVMIHLDRTQALQPLLEAREEVVIERKAPDAGVRPATVGPAEEEEEEEQQSETPDALAAGIQAELAS